MFTRVTDLRTTQGSVPGQYYKAALVCSTVTDFKRRDICNILSELTSPLGPDSPASPYNAAVKKKERDKSKVS